ncbi:MAG: pilus assembly protein PilM [Pirellulales bacterium]
MASGGIWGIDIGQCGLKALRCELNDEGNGAVATAFDFIEYPMILSQPDADPEELVREAFATFLSRNKIKGDRIAMSVSGQFGLTRFFGPPPCQIKQLPDLVRFEAKQTVPFPLEEVVWDWHRMAGGMEVEGFLMETQVGLFAMKREQVFKALAPFTRAGIELDIIQLAPVAIYNAITHDLLNDATEEYDAENPPESLVLLSMGTDTTDLVITNGYRMWLRSIPVGGSHFTKQLVRELKLTFSKAEHTKRNARQAEDPKVIFQAMRPIFNDMVNEIQRSLMNFENNNRKAKLSKLVMLGNAIKLTGLTHHLSKNLGHDLFDLTSFKRLDTTAIESSPSFKENQLSFGVSYGLCLQGLGLAKVPTNLMPREIVTQRIIREKKPWTLAGVSALLLAWALSYFLVNDKWYTVHPSRAVAGTTWEEAGRVAENVSTTSRNHKSKDDEKVAQLKVLKALGDEVAGNNDRRLMWLELVSTLTYALPRTENVQPGVPPDPKVVPFTARKEIHVDFIESEYFKDLTLWFTPQIRDKYLEGKRYIEALEKGQAPPPAQPGADAAAAVPGAAPGVPPAAPAATSTAATDPAAAELKGPEKEGWVVELRGYHYYNGDPRTSGRTHVLNTLLRSLEKLQITLPGELLNGEPVTFTMQERGVLFPTLIMDDKIDLNYRIPNPLFDASMSGDGTGAAGMAAGMAPGMGMGMGPGKGSGFGGGGLGGGGLGGGKAGAKGKDKDKAKDREEPESYEAPRYQFTIQFVWQPMPLTKRLQMKAEQLAKAKADRDAAMAAGGVPGTIPAPGAAAPGAAVPGVAAPVPGAPAVPAPAAAPGPAAPGPAAPGPAAPGPAAPGPAAPGPAAPGPAAPGPAAPGPAAPGPAAPGPAAAVPE